MYDIAIVLGARIGIRDGKMCLAPHTEMRVRAAGVLWKKGLARRFILTGGHNIGVRFDLDISVPIFGRPDSDREPDFSEAAKEKARCYRSEASVMAELMKKDYAVPPEVLILEEDAHSTADNAKKVKDILKRISVTDVALITNLFHMDCAIQEFRQAGMTCKPLYAEPPYVKEDENRLPIVLSYYSTPFGNVLWNKEEVCDWLLNGGNIPKSTSMKS